MKPKISDLIWLALALAILPAISLADSLPNQILWNKDGAEMAYIPAGSFEMGDAMNETESYMERSRPVHTVTLDGFYMDKTEVTVGQFKAFLADSDYIWGGSWTSVDQYSLTDDHPMIYVTWWDAVAYATWAGKRLPTEAEWEKAARGGLAGKRYPWGDEVDNTKAHYDSWNDGNGTTQPVGSYAANGYGLYDVAGNVWEWCLDKSDSSYYDNSPAENPLSTDYADIQALLDNYDSVSSRRVLRGGDWNTSANYLRVAHRNNHSPNS
ncbi:MAG: formylglycine-generating enzyme family protein, partial [Gammaproteobacteria bacterium]|nr:formylglycine-generating enzyme family protein [Gammaproteobacteria bacterium]